MGKKTKSANKSHQSARPPPVRPSSCPPGLGYLAQVDQLVVNQQIDMMNVFTGWETKNRYVVCNSIGQQVYFAVEESRPFNMVIMDNQRMPVLRIKRPYQLEGCGCCGFVQKIEVFTGVGQLLGSVTEVWQCCGKKFSIKNAQDQIVFWLEGPVCTFDFFDADFDLLTADGKHKLGAITRQFPGLMKEMFTKADVFGIRFPMDLEVWYYYHNLIQFNTHICLLKVGMKAVLLAATFLIDFMYYEKPSDQTNMRNDGDSGAGMAMAGMMMMGNNQNNQGFNNNNFNNNPGYGMANAQPQPMAGFGSNSSDPFASGMNMPF